MLSGHPVIVNKKEARGNRSSRKMTEMECADGRIITRVQLTVRQLQELIDRKNLFKMLDEGQPMGTIVPVIERLTGRSRSWIYKMKQRHIENPKDLLPHSIPGRTRKLRKMVSMMNTIERNLKKENKRNNKSPRRLEKHFRASALVHEGVIAVN